VLRLGVITGALLLLAVAGALQARASSQTQTSATSPTSVAGPFAKFRVCGTNKIPFKGNLCPRDQRRSGLVFREIDCSVQVTVRKKSPFTATILYRGQLQYIAHSVLKPGKHNELVGVRVNSSRMPGGKYACTFRVGKKRMKVGFETEGPSGEFVGKTVCVTPRGRKAFCKADASTKPISKPASIMCGGVFVGFTGKSWGVKIVRLTKTTPALVGQYGAKRLPGPISEQWVAFKSRTKVGVYRPAKYACLFFAAGKEIAQQTFTIAG
jgi:hypothetical protein